MEKRTALFAGSFDPFTRGHEVLVEEILGLFDEVVIAIGENIRKQGLLPVEKRRQLIEDCYRHEPRVKVCTYRTLTTDLAREVGATALVRGVRNTLDFTFEQTLAAANRRLMPELTTLLLFTPHEVSDISSSMIRELVAFGHDVSELMPRGIRLEEYLTR